MIFEHVAIDNIQLNDQRDERIAAGKPVDDYNRMMGEFDAISNGGLVNFTSLVDGAERFDYVMNNRETAPTLGHEQKKAIGYSNPSTTSQTKTLQADPKKSKLAALNE